jgi:SHS2 domain-containing protein
MPWRELPHTADLRLEISAPDWPQLLKEATLALAAQLGQPKQDAAPVVRALQLDALDREELLVRWLSEILVWNELENLLPVDAEITDAGETKAVGRIILKPSRRRAANIQAVTYHGLAFEQTAAGLVVRVLFDM